MILVHTVLICLIGIIAAAFISVYLFLVAALLGFRITAWTSESPVLKLVKFSCQAAHLCLSVTDTGCSCLVISFLNGTGSEVRS